MKLNPLKKNLLVSLVNPWGYLCISILRQTKKYLIFPVFFLMCFVIFIADDFLICGPTFLFIIWYWKISFKFYPVQSLFVWKKRKPCAFEELLKKKLALLKKKIV